MLYLLCRRLFSVFKMNLMSIKYRVRLACTNCDMLQDEIVPLRYNADMVSLHKSSSAHSSTIQE